MPVECNTTWQYSWSMEKIRGCDSSLVLTTMTAWPASTLLNARTVGPFRLRWDTYTLRRLTAAIHSRTAA